MASNIENEIARLNQMEKEHAMDQVTSHIEQRRSRDGSFHVRIEVEVSRDAFNRIVRGEQKLGDGLDRLGADIQRAISQLDWRSYLNHGNSDDPDTDWYDAIFGGNTIHIVIS